MFHPFYGCNYLILNFIITYVFRKVKINLKPMEFPKNQGSIGFVFKASSIKVDILYIARHKV